MDQYNLTEQRHKWLKEYVMEAVKRRTINEAKINNETTQDIINALRSEIHAMPLSNSKGTIPIKKVRGDVITHGLMCDDISIVDRIELGYNSETLRAKTKSPTTFVIVAGKCDLHYVEEGEKIIHKLNTKNPKWLEDKTPFAISNNGSKCRIFLITEEK